MSIERDDVKKMAHLARLHLDDAALDSYSDELSKIVDFIGTMNQVDTDDVQAMAHPHDVMQRLREDVVTQTNRREQLQANAPSQADGLFLVPKVIE